MRFRCYKTKELEMVGEKTMKRNQNHVFIFNSSLAKVILIVFSLFWSSGETCTKTQFTVVYRDKTTSCEDCGSCSPGLGLSHECGKNISSNAMVTCEECEQGKSFSRRYDTSSCTPCAVCSEDQVVLQNCTPTMNVKCAARCYSKYRYYDNIYGGCLPCSKCCGDSGDVLQVECRSKMGAASNMICSFNSSFDRCDTMSTASPQETTTVTNTPAYVGTTSDAVTQSTINQGGQGSPSPSQRKGLSNSRAPSITIPLVATFGSLFVIGGCVASFLWYKRKRCMSYFRRSSDAEAGTQPSEYELKELGSAVHGAVRKVMNLEGQSGSSEPLLGKDPAQLVCQCQLEEMGTKKDSKPLQSLLEHLSTLERICVVLDTPMPGCGCYKEVAQYYGFDHYMRESVLKPSDGGPSRALIGYLAATNPELTVEQFAAVVKETKRKDVLKLLGEYDVAECESL